MFTAAPVEQDLLEATELPVAWSKLMEAGYEDYARVVQAYRASLSASDRQQR